MVRHRKNNAVLVIQPGTGKTAIAEGLAKNCSSGDSLQLYGERMLSFDLTAAMGC